MHTQKIILVTGASSGIGKVSAEALVEQGHCVYGTTRDIESANFSEGIVPLQLDMTDYGSLENAIDTIIREQGRIDVLFNNAGYGQFGTVEETPIVDAKHQFDVNLFGLARLTQLVLPHMREARSGMIINMSSFGGRLYTPLGAWYHATKYALEGWSDCLRLELKEFDIGVVIVEPGGIQTEWGSIAIKKLRLISGKGPYKKLVRATIDRLERTYEKPGSLSPPSVVADAVVKAVASDRPKTRYVVGKYARRLLLAHTLLPDRLYDRLVLRKT